MLQNSLVKISYYYFKIQISLTLFQKLPLFVTQCSYCSLNIVQNYFYFIYLKYSFWSLLILYKTQLTCKSIFSKSCSYLKSSIHFQNYRYKFQKYLHNILHNYTIIYLPDYIKVPKTSSIF